MKKLNRRDLIEVGTSGLLRNDDGAIRISIYGKRNVILYWSGFTGDYEIHGTSISDCIKQYNAI